MKINEVLARASIPVFINSFNQFTYLRDLVNNLIANGFRNIWILDNCSTYPPLLEYYKLVTNQLKGVVNVAYYKTNNGPHYFHRTNFYKSVWSYGHFYTDPDLVFDYVDPEFVQTFIKISDLYKVAKVGAALTIPSNEDMVDVRRAMPETGNRPVTVQEWERQFWVNEIAPRVFKAGVDTTFHFFNPRFFNIETFYSGLRLSGVGFEAKHRPWFRSALCPAEETDFYKRSCEGGHGGWA